jgi:hypothetical protein
MEIPDFEEFEGPDNFRLVFNELERVRLFSRLLVISIERVYWTRNFGASSPDTLNTIRKRWFCFSGVA